MIFEVCVDSLASARAAIRGGADRLELCSALAIGGLTPYAELLRQIRRESSIPIRCLMRPRAGDFLYSQEEIAMMAAQIEDLRALGADGFVIGCLDAQGIGIFRNAFGPKQVRHHFMEGNVREAFIALTCLCFSCMKLLGEGFLECFGGVMGTIVAKVQCCFFPNFIGFLCVDIHQRSV